MMRELLACLLLFVAFVAQGVSSVQAQSCDPADDACGPIIRETGYVAMSDGVRLRWTVLRPDVDHAVPVALQVDPYVAGIDPVGINPVDLALLEAGYAFMGVNLRGTGCSGGAWDTFRPYSDGYELVEWVAGLPWSTGDVGMVGYSADGIAAITTAGMRPPQLRAIAPNEVVTDLYRDFAYPGGILNLLSPIYSTAFRQAQAASRYDMAIAEGDAVCLEHHASRDQLEDRREPIEGVQRPYLTDWYTERDPGNVVGQIEVPVLTCASWQDGQVGSRAGTSWVDALPHDQFWATFTNGYHGACDWSDDMARTVVKFFDEFVHPERDTDFERTEPRVTIWHETVNWDLSEPAWITTFDEWPPPVTAATLYLTADGALRLDPAGQKGVVDYLYPSPPQSMEADDYSSEYFLWTAPPVPETFASWTTPPLARDVEIFGPASADLWVTSTAPSTDLQVTLTEVRADGQEMYLQRGWLRASHRALDEKASTALRPVHTHHEADVNDLGEEAQLLRVAIQPIGHVFRAGSSIRISIDAPGGLNGYWRLMGDPTPAINSIHVGGDHQSRLVLGLIPGQATDAMSSSNCEALSTPCRINPFASVPDGELTLAAAADETTSTLHAERTSDSGGMPATGGGLVLTALTVLGASTLTARRFGENRRSGTGLSSSPRPS